MPETNNFVTMALERLGVDPTNLGCVMLDVEMPAIYKTALDPKWAYYSSTLKHVNGYSGKEHVTLLYGLLLKPETNTDLIDGVMEGWRKPTELLFDTVDCFESNDGVADYGALVLRPSEIGHSSDISELDLASLYDANYRLGKLPHVRSFPDYNPHITVGYVQSTYISLAKAALTGVSPRPMPVVGVSF